MYFQGGVILPGSESIRRHQHRMRRRVAGGRGISCLWSDACVRMKT